jgi:NDP-sugar pyrophosphorylase family protein
MIRDVVGSGERFGLKVSYSEDGPTLLGTGGALKEALPLLGSHFFVLYGDSYLPVNFSAVQAAYEQSKRQSLMTVLRNQDLWDKSNVLFVDGVLREYNKKEPSPHMTYIDYGLGIVSDSVFLQYSSNRSFDLADVYQYLSIRGQLSGFEVHERFYEIGSHRGLKETEYYFLTKENK